MNLDLFTNTKSRRSGKAGWNFGPGLLLAAVLVFVTAFIPANWSMPDWKRMGSRTESAIVPSPTHIEWTSYPVGGMVLCQPPDSTGKMSCIKLPAGSVLSVPRLVKGADPDSLKDQT